MGVISLFVGHVLAKMSSPLRPLQAQVVLVIIA